MTRLPNDCFALPPGVDWVPVDEALVRLDDSLSCVVGTETLDVIDSSGRVLARDLTALRDNPPTANSAVDGYGLCHDEAKREMPLMPGRAAAGAAFKGKLARDHALRILTGAPLPAGVDTVVLQEDCEVSGGKLTINHIPKCGANSRAAGEDVKRGALLLAAGHRADPANLALLAATGYGAVPVFNRLRVGVVSTGDELVAAGATAKADQTFDANRPMLLSMLAKWGYDAVDLGAVGDDRTDMRDTLNDAVGRCDAVLCSGGASAGDEDHVSALLRSEGSLSSWRIALKPGRPLVLAQWQGVPVFGLPGNPVAAFVCAVIFARPALLKLAGGGFDAPQGFEVPAGFGKSKKPGRREYLRARIANGRAEAFPSEGSGRISGLSWAQGLIELPDHAMELRAGDPVMYYPYASFGL